MESRGVLKTINRYFEVMTDIIMAHHGTVNKFMGDGILVFFGAPRVLPDPARSAVACAAEMQGAMEALNDEQEKMGLPRLSMGIGINSGELIVGNIGSEKRKEYGAIGSAINVAFRVEGKTRPGEIIVTSSIRDKLGDDLIIGSSWNGSLKGIGDTTLYQVTGIREK
jgi:class 3 adenylate cyclase